eukprot:12891481-Prorocentrum_lima.AAC.1
MLKSDEDRPALANSLRQMALKDMLPAIALTIPGTVTEHVRLCATQTQRALKNALRAVEGKGSGNNK